MRRLLSILLVSISATVAGQPAAPLREGDILFQFIPCGPLCDAIVATTPCANEHPFNHCGIVVCSGDSVQVLEAIGRNVHTTALPAFLKRDRTYRVRRPVEGCRGGRHAG